MATYINLEELINLVTFTYGRSTLTGNEWAKIFRIRYGKDNILGRQDQKPSAYARNSQNSGQISGSLSDD